MIKVSIYALVTIDGVCPAMNDHYLVGTKVLNTGTSCAKASPAEVLRY